MHLSEERVNVQVPINKFSCANELYKIVFKRWRIAAAVGLLPGVSPVAAAAALFVSSHCESRGREMGVVFGTPLRVPLVIMVMAAATAAFVPSPLPLAIVFRVISIVPKGCQIRSESAYPYLYALIFQNSISVIFVAHIRDSFRGV